MAQDAQVRAGVQGGCEEAAGDLADGQVLHGAVAAGVEDHVVRGGHDVLEAGGDAERLVDRREVRGDGIGLLLAPVGLGGQAGRVDGGGHAARGGDGDVKMGLGEDAVRGGELLGPEAGGMGGAVVEGPVVGTGEDEQYGGHGGCSLRDARRKT